TPPAGSARSGPIRGLQALVGAREGRHQGLELRGRQAGERHEPLPVAPDFCVGQHEANVFLNSDKVFWAGDTRSPHNSQHLLDPYSFTHVLHGVVLCGLLTWGCPRLAPPWRLGLAVLVEALWE